ncbi:GPI ethanolamine phosphate transferase 2-like [Liolophura sinensis]|uniref:GPI ethanolamine phosphate transferase 2-like n=1 Tax=Liolophura sinensis TaxID=3198878 RepID=UPI003158AB2A
MEISINVFLCVNLLLMVFSCSIFLQGFMPSKSVLPGHATNTPAIENATFLSHKRLIILVIDALRKDFLYGDKDYMQYTRKLIHKRETVPLVVKLQLPTVTLPRIKALTTGGIPSFADVVKNFDSQKLTEDNLLDQFQRAGKKLVFFGDETWLKLFPDYFIRADPTTSFFVSDYTEVDQNVSRHLDTELGQSDWDVMILHYLGLDHIGHLAGPKSPLVKPKLREMDQVVENIHRSLMQQMTEGQGDSLLLLCGDHGMADQGGHGGASPSETTTPAVFISTKFANGKGLPYDDNIVVQQIDLAPTLATLYGLPIPMNNLGMLIPQVLQEASTADIVRLYQQNAEQLWRILQLNLPDPAKDRSFILYEELQQATHAWLSSGKTQSGQRSWETQGQGLVRQYQQLIQTMQEKVASSLSSYDLYAMSVGMISLWMIFLTLILHLWTNSISSVAVHLGSLTSVSTLLTILLWVTVHLTVCTSTHRNDLLCGDSLVPVIMQLGTVSMVCFFSITVVHFFQMFCQKAQRNKGFFFTTWFERLLLIGSFLHGVSFMSSSFVEEEHQTWYFFTTTLQILTPLLIMSRSFDRAEVKRSTSLNSGDTKVKDFDLHLKSPETMVLASGESQYLQHFETSSKNGPKVTHNSSQQGCCTNSSSPEKSKFGNTDKHKRSSIVNWRAIAASFSITLLGRLARSLNQTGNKWLNQPDVGDWLVNADNKSLLSGTVACAILVILSMRLGAHRGLVRLLLPLGMLGVYCFRAANQMLWLPETWPKSTNGTWEARLVYMSTLAIITETTLTSMYRTKDRQCYSKADVVLEDIQSCWVLLMTLVLKPHNTVLVAIMVVQERLLSKCVVDDLNLSTPAQTVWYFWMGQAAFFYQGNSNSISTIDVSAGYIGLTDYQPVLITILLTVSTYAGLFLLADQLLKHNVP